MSMTLEHGPQNVSPITKKYLLDRKTIFDWPSIRSVITPAWQRVMGENTISSLVNIMDVNEPAAASALRDLFAGQADPQSDTALVYYDPSEPRATYNTVFHELVHLWHHRHHKSIMRDIMGDALVSFESKFKSEEEKNRISQFMNNFYPDLYEHVIDVYKIANGVNESATEATAMLLLTEFVRMNSLPRRFLQESFTVFSCDDPKRYIALAAALVRHGFDFVETSRYFMTQDPVNVVADLAPMVQYLSGEGRVEEVAAQMSHKLKFECGVDIDSVEAFSWGKDAFPQYPNKRRHIEDELPKVTASILWLSYADYNFDSFLTEIEKYTLPESIPMKVAHIISLTYNALLNNLPVSHDQLRFAQGLAQGLRQRYPQSIYQFRTMLRGIESLRDEK